MDKALRVRCAYCDAAPGEPCRTAKGTVAAVIHLMRKRYARMVFGRE